MGQRGDAYRFSAAKEDRFRVFSFLLFSVCSLYRQTCPLPAAEQQDQSSPDSSPGSSPSSCGWKRGHTLSGTVMVAEASLVPITQDSARVFP